MAGIPFVRDLQFKYGEVARVSPLIRRVIAENPGPFTYLGTGVYIVGNGEKLTVALIIVIVVLTLKPSGLFGDVAVKRV